MKLRLIYILIILMYSCDGLDNEPYKLPDNAVALISSDGIKTWKIAERYNGKVRMNMHPCFLSYRQTFLKDSVFYDNNGNSGNCGKTLTGQWHLHKNGKGDHFIKLMSPQISQLLNIPEDYKLFKILYLSEDTLKLAFDHKQYGSNKTIITDLLVREDLDVGDRYYYH
ncbi:lipocalin family protein [Autumnicola edwardsiae]|uniref:Lipocalin family protein n=1 Tax=Autumnicola edwardsiae TaxID=3075594 RepID=A0ABU3CSV3_9FLAO|nr:lipocalin family protein [Zunongwangia sp. F297]MDT0649449.1 lipocalin family protein [Zunongwangia sp. F297]